MANDKTNLEKDAKQIRRMIIETSYEANACHIGSALSCVEILLNIESKMKKNDIFIFSKASGIAAYYCLLAHRGKLNKNMLVYYLKNYPLPSKEVPGILHSVGSLGHGLPVACGLALGDKTRNIFILMSDAELQEGTTWECLLFKNQHKLDNLKIYVDYNGLQACERINKILHLPLYFLTKNNFNVIKTIKGKGVSFMENHIIWHYMNLTKELYKKALQEL